MSVTPTHKNGYNFGDVYTSVNGYGPTNSHADPTQAGPQVYWCKWFVSVNFPVFGGGILLILGSSLVASSILPSLAVPLEIVGSGKN